MAIERARTTAKHSGLLIRLARTVGSTLGTVAGRTKVPSKPAPKRTSRPEVKTECDKNEGKKTRR